MIQQKDNKEISPQKKARSLVYFYYDKITDCYDYGKIQRELSKECALIAVDEILSATPITSFDGNPEYKEPADHMFWNEVKKEIQKL